jgi:hypothetical protein
MSDLYAELIARLDDPVDLALSPGPYADALRAVVYLHPTEQHYTIGQDNRRTPSGLYCRRCKTSAPCEEIQVIAEKLGIPAENEGVR